MGKASAEARRKKWGQKEFARRLREWGRLGLEDSFGLRMHDDPPVACSIVSRPGLPRRVSGPDPTVAD